MVATPKLTFCMLSATVLKVCSLLLMQVKIIFDLLYNEAGDEDSGTSVTVTAATATSASRMFYALM
jgi:hypothetical protein